MINIAIIPARGGSKGLPRKNVLNVGGKPLIAWTIEAALDTSIIDLVYVSTDNEEIAQISRQFGAKVIMRPAEFATDGAGTEPVIEHAINILNSEGINCSQVFLLQATSPLRTASHIEKAYARYIEEGASCVISVFEPKHSPAKAYIILDSGEIDGLLSKSAPYTRRQDLPKAVQPNGAIYIFSVIQFMKHKVIPRTKVFPFFMTEYESIDIDDQDDFNAVNTMMEK
jgi:CMP-N,N'-diacetyllegionaminic acid synthase